MDITCLITLEIQRRWNIES